MTTPHVTSTFYDIFSVQWTNHQDETIYGTIIGEHEGRLLVEEHPPNYNRRIITISEAFLHELVDKKLARPTLKYLAALEDTS